ncbi:RNA 2',3'-cyclic phosphodiesterase [Candidatus Pacearchaeota archaeon]|nr:RNA 2',3'-cyclic phosphodiesterase [Candidatus Pacearchaeota archaeon]
MTDKKLTRCFVALDLPRRVINEIREIQKLLKKRISFNCKYTEPENLHLTLKFLGEISEEQIDEVKKRLSEITMNDFEVGLGKVGSFESRFSYIIWVELNNSFVRELQKKIDDKLKNLFQSEFRFMGHITIVRARKMTNSKELKQYLKTIKPRKLGIKIDRFFLKKSDLKETGPEYSDLEVYELSNKP